MTKRSREERYSKLKKWFETRFLSKYTRAHKLWCTTLTYLYCSGYTNTTQRKDCDNNCRFRRLSQRLLASASLSKRMNFRMLVKDRGLASDNLTRRHSTCTTRTSRRLHRPSGCELTASWLSCCSLQYSFAKITLIAASGILSSKPSPSLLGCGICRTLYNLLKLGCRKRPPTRFVPT